MFRRFPVLALALLSFLVLTAPVLANTGTVCGSATVTTLFAGQTIDAGTVRAYNDNTNLYVEITTKNGWHLTESHLAIAQTLAGIPQTKSGNPKVGNFPYKRTYNPPVTSDVYTFTLGKKAAVRKVSG